MQKSREVQAGFNSKRPIMAFLGVLAGMATAWGQLPPNSLTLTAKLRDLPSAGTTLPAGVASHPHFNTCVGGQATGMVQTQVVVTPPPGGDTTLGDNRNPVLSANPPGNACLTNAPGRFLDWFNDANNPAINRSFKLDLTFTRNNAGLYEYLNGNFFPLDPGGPFTKFNAADPNPYNDLFSSAGNHNFGFTMELHTQFTYQAGTAQTFTFTGDDDVWVFVNGQLLIDIGGVHGAITSSFNLDNEAARIGLINGTSYPLDFFFAERHTTESNCRITTSIQLVQQPQPISPPVAAPPGQPFASQITVTLSHPLNTATSDSVKIHYTLDNTAPTSASPVYNKNTPIVLIGTTTIRAIAIHDNDGLYLPSAEMVPQVYTKSFTASTLEILDASNPPLPFSAGYITQNATGYTVRLTTTQAGLTGATINAKTVTGADVENILLTSVTNLGGRFVYTGVIPFSVATAILGDSKTQSALYDSLSVSWTNPSDANDKPQAKLRVRAAPQQAQVFFATDSTGTTPTTTYAATATLIYVFVRDEQLPPGQSASIALSSTSAVTSRNDRATLPLTYLGNGLYRAQVTIDIDGVTSLTDTKLQLTSGDQIQADFIDPLDGDIGKANAGFGQPAVISAQLLFIDKNGLPTVAGADYSPAEGRIYLRLVDDWAGGSILTDTVTLSIINKNGDAPSDAEIVILTRINGSRVGDQVNYEGSIALKDLPSPKKQNDTAETYWRGVVTAKITGHDAGGNPETRELTAVLNVAYPDSKSVIKVVDGENDTATINRGTTSIVIKLDEQSNSSGPDTLTVNVVCVGSGDILNNVKLIEVSPGKYESVKIPKNENTPAADGTLSCKSDDVIKVSYTDPLHPTDKSDIDIPIKDFTVGTLSFTKIDGTSQITAAEELDSNFIVYVQGKSPSIGKVDTIQVTLSIAGGDAEVFNAVETGNATGIFKVTVPFQFVTAPKKSNAIVEGVIAPTNLNNRVILTATAKTENNDVSGTLTLVAGLIPPQSAYITDKNSNGKGDQVVVQFPKPLPRLPATLDIYWNNKDVPVKTVPVGKLTFLPGSNNTVVVADLSNDEYPDTLSGAGNGPYVQLPNESLFGHSTVALEDRIPPTILKVVKKPVDLLVVKKDDVGFNIDTLVITLSEPLKDASITKTMLLYDLQCGAVKDAKQLTADATPTVSADGKTITVLVNNTAISPPVGSCLYLDQRAGTEVVDKKDNIAVGKSPITGNDGSRLISGLRGYPPVAGLDPNDPKWQAAINDARQGADDLNGSYATPTTSGNNPWEILWVPPADLDQILAGNPYLPPDGVGSAGNGNKETVRAQPLPFTAGNSEGIAQAGSGQSVKFKELPGIVQLVTTTKYIVDIAIFDQLGKFVRHQKQSFGYQGELANRERIVPGGYASFLVWDLRAKDKNGPKVGQGVYIWKLTFNFEGKRQQVKYVRTGVTRKD